MTVIENALRPEDLRRRRARHPGLVIGCVAGREHQSDFAQLKLGELLQRLLREHEGLRIVTFGEHLGFRDPRYTHRTDIPIGELIRHETEFDIGLAPLVDSPLNRARSDVKLKEYAAAGAMWLASPLGPYLGLGEQQGGLLVPDREWHTTLDALIRDPQRRLALSEGARAWARQKTTDQTAAAWEAAFLGAVERARARQPAR